MTLQYSEAARFYFVATFAFFIYTDGRSLEIIKFEFSPNDLKLGRLNTLLFRWEHTKYRSDWHDKCHVLFLNFYLLCVYDVGAGMYATEVEVRGQLCGVGVPHGHRVL